MKLIQANSAQTLERDRLAHEAWGQRLSVDQFVAREAALRSQPWCKKAMISWILMDDQDQANPKALSSCETFEMRSFFRGKPGRSFGIASVLTEAELRGRGYASMMLARLADYLRATVSDMHAMFLYSEVGEGIYRRVGFEPIPSMDRVFQAMGGRFKGPSGFEWLDQSRCLREFESRLAPLSGDFSVQPTADQVGWFFQRQRIYSESLKKDEPAYGGASIGRSHLVWMADFKSEMLRVLLLQAESPEIADALILASRHYAGELGFATVRIRDKDAFQDWTQLRTPGDSEPAADGITMIRPMTPGLSPSMWTTVPRVLWV